MSQSSVPPPSPPSSTLFTSSPLLPSSLSLPSPPITLLLHPSPSSPVLTGSMVHSVFGHRGIVSCIAYCPEKGLCGSEGCGFIASGSHDATVLLWRWSGKQDGVLNPTSKDLGQLVAIHVCVVSVYCVLHRGSVHGSHMYVIVHRSMRYTYSSSPAPVALLTGHEQAVITVSISATVGAVVSATKSEALCTETIT